MIPPSTRIEDVYLNALFKRIMEGAQRQFPKGRVNDQYIIALDPGETTGVCLYNPYKPNQLRLMQLKTKPVGPGAQMIQWLVEELQQAEPPASLSFVCEDYRVYSWKSDDHKWSAIHTAQLIGAIKYICYRWGVPITFRMAQEAKGFCTDQKLEQWGVYEAGMRHARDAQRHMLFQLLFGSTHKTQAQEGSDVQV